MIELNREHPGFSLPMELLALMPSPPTVALVDAVCDDLDITRAQLDDAVRRCKSDLGIRFVRTGPQVAREIRVDPDSWQRCHDLASAYFDTVYGDTP